MVEYYFKKRRSFLDRFSNMSFVMIFIIVSVVISFLFFILNGISEEYVKYIALKPSNILEGKYVWTLVTHMFAHAGLFHLFINMFVLFSLGGLCERIIGSKRFAWFYLLSGVFAGILSVLLSGIFGSSGWGARVFGSPDIYMVGASGAIFAIAGLYVILLPRLRFMIIFLPFFSLPAYIMIPLTLFVMWGLSVINNWPIGNVAHFGGFLAGIFYGLYLRTKYHNKIKRLQRMIR